MHLNIRSVRNKVDFLESFTDDIDILCLTETHLDPSVPDSDLLLTNFSTIFRKDRNAFGGGVMIFSTNDILPKRRFDIESPNDEIIWIELCSDNKKYLLICII